LRLRLVVGGLVEIPGCAGRGGRRRPGQLSPCPTSNQPWAALSPIGLPRGLYGADGIDSGVSALKHPGTTSLRPPSPLDARNPESTPRMSASSGRGRGYGGPGQPSPPLGDANRAGVSTMVEAVVPTAPRNAARLLDCAAAVPIRREMPPNASHVLPIGEISSRPLL
jgi:hypothetical protein